MSVDILTSWDQCRSIVQYSFMSTKTRRLARMDSPGWPPRLSHSSWTLLPSSFIIFYLSSYTWRRLCWKRLCLIVPCVSSMRWVHFSRAVLFCQPHQQLFTHATACNNQASIWWPHSITLNSGFREPVLCSVPQTLHSWQWQQWCAC